MKRLVHFASCLATVLALSGCYTYAPVAPSAVAPGTTVRVSVTPEEALRQQPRLGVLRQQIEGSILAAGADTVGIAMRAPAGSPADRPGYNTYVGVPTNAVVQMEEKRFSALRTGLLAGAGALVAAAVIALAVESAGQDAEPPPSGEMRIPLLRIPLLSR